MHNLDPDTKKIELITYSKLFKKVSLYLLIIYTNIVYYINNIFNHK
jgi:hypothetical protein